jgi:hypothetical protein
LFLSASRSSKTTLREARPRRVAVLWLALYLLLPTTAMAQRETTREALSRLEETLTARQQEGALSKELLPIMVVSVKPSYEESRTWFPTEGLKTLVAVFGVEGLRSCEACMQPRLHVDEGRVEHNTAELSLAEIARLDEAGRGTGTPARSAVWLDETAEGVSIRLIDLRNSRILLAENFDKELKEPGRTRKTVSLAKELDRRNRGDSLAHVFADFGLFPGQHISFDWTEQWGDTNANISGVSVSIFDPVLGIGASYFRVIPWALNLMVGAKVLISLPTAIVASISPGTNQLIDPLVTGALMVRVPIASSNYGLVLFVSTNGRVGLGLSLMNISFLPFLP